MDRVNEQHAERIVGTVLECTGFAGINKSILQRLMKSPIMLLKTMSMDLVEMARLKNKRSVGLDDCKYLLEQRGENIGHLLHFLRNQSSSRQPVTVCYPVVKQQNSNPLKIPEINSLELKSQPSYIDDHLPLLRDALEYKSNQKRTMDMYKQGGFNNDHSAANDSMEHGRENGEQSKRKYPSEAGRSRYRMRAVMMIDGGEVCCQGLSNRRGPSASPPPATHVNTLLSAFQANSTPFADGLSYAKTSTTASRTSAHPKNGIVPGIADLQNSFAITGGSPSVAAGPGVDNRDVNGSYASPRDDLPVVDDDEDVKPSKIWPPLKEEPLPSSYNVDSPLTRKQNDSRSRNLSEWPNSPLNLTSSSKIASSMTNTPLSIPTQSKPKESLASRLNKSTSKKDLTALFSNKSDMLDVLDSPPPTPVAPPKSSKSSKKSTSRRSAAKSNSRPKPKAVETPVAVEPPKSSSQSKNRKRAFEETLEEVKPEERVEAFNAASSPTPLHSAVERLKPSSSRHKQSKSKGSSETSLPSSSGSSSSKNKRRKVESSSTPDSSRSRSKISPDVTVANNLCLKPEPEPPCETPPEKEVNERSQSNTPSRVNDLRLSSDEDEIVIRRDRKTSRSPPPSNKRRLSEWEDVPLSKRVPCSGNSVKAEPPAQEFDEDPPNLEESGDNEKMVKLGPNLTMKFNLAKIKQDSTSGTASPASTTAPPPAAALETNPALVLSGEKIVEEEEEEYDWVRDHALARRRQRSGSISDGGEDAAVMRFHGPPGPSPPSLPDEAQPLNLLSVDDAEADERRTSTDSLPPPSLIPTVPLPKIKIQKVKKGTTASFVTAPDPPRSKRRPPRRSQSPRSPSPPTLAPALTPPRTECDDSAPTLTLVPPSEPVESVVLEDEQTAVEEKYHSQTLLPPSKTTKKSSTGSSSSKKKLSKRSASRSRSRPKVSSKRVRPKTPPVLERSPTPPTPPALLEPACEDLGFGFQSSTSPAGSPCHSPPPPPPTPPAPPVLPRAKSKPSKNNSSNVSKKGGSSAEKITSSKSKKAASSSAKTKSHGGSKSTTPAPAATSAPAASSTPAAPSASTGGGNKPPSTPAGDVPMEFTNMGVDVVSHGSSYYFDSHGVQIWICPLCHMEDNGSLMIGCDACDDWYHGRCLNIFAEPDEDTWYCPRCVQKNKSNTPKNKKKSSKTGRRRA